jgi:hypothetical protein
MTSTHIYRKIVVGIELDLVDKTKNNFPCFKRNLGNTTHSLRLYQMKYPGSWTRGGVVY